MLFIYYVPWAWTLWQSHPLSPSRCPGIPTAGAPAWLVSPCPPPLPPAPPSPPSRSPALRAKDSITQKQTFHLTAWTMTVVSTQHGGCYPFEYRNIKFCEMVMIQKKHCIDFEWIVHVIPGWFRQCAQRAQKWVLWRWMLHWLLNAIADPAVLIVVKSKLFLLRFYGYGAVLYTMAALLKQDFKNHNTLLCLQYCNTLLCLQYCNTLLCLQYCNILLCLQYCNILNWSPSIIIMHHIARLLPKHSHNVTREREENNGHKSPTESSEFLVWDHQEVVLGPTYPQKPLLRLHCDNEVETLSICEVPVEHQQHLVLGVVLVRIV